MFDALVLAPCDRSAIWLGKSLAVLAFLVAAEVVALPAFAVFFSGVGGRTSPRSRSRTSASPPSGRSSARWPSPGRARELLLPLLFLPLAIPIVGRRRRAGYLWFLALYDAVFALLAWALVRVRRRRDRERRRDYHDARETDARHDRAAAASASRSSCSPRRWR